MKKWFTELYSHLILCKLTVISEKEYITILNEKSQKKKYEFDIDKLNADDLHLKNKKEDILKLVLRITYIFVYTMKEKTVLQ